MRTTSSASGEARGLPAGVAHPVEQQPTRFARQANADRQTLRVAQLPLHAAEGPQVVGDLFDVVGVADLEARSLVEQVGQRGLGAHDLRGQQGLLADGAWSSQSTDASRPDTPASCAKANSACRFRSTMQVGASGGSAGGSGRGTKAWTDSPGVVVVA